VANGPEVTDAQSPPGLILEADDPGWSGPCLPCQIKPDLGRSQRRDGQLVIQ
jgi:hypothetical protein